MMGEISLQSQVIQKTNSPFCHRPGKVVLDAIYPSYSKKFGQIHSGLSSSAQQFWLSDSTLKATICRAAQSSTTALIKKRKEKKNQQKKYPPLT